MHTLLLVLAIGCPVATWAYLFRYNICFAVLWIAGVVREIVGPKREYWKPVDNHQNEEYDIYG